MFYNLSNDIQLDYNPITKNASLVLSAKGTVPAYIYCIDSIMFSDMLLAIRKIYTTSLGTTTTITSPYVNNQDSITVTRGEDYVKVTIKGSFQLPGKATVSTIDKAILLKLTHIPKFLTSILGPTPQKPKQPSVTP